MIEINTSSRVWEILQRLQRIHPLIHGLLFALSFVLWKTVWQLPARMFEFGFALFIILVTLYFEVSRIQVEEEVMKSIMGGETR